MPCLHKLANVLSGLSLVFGPYFCCLLDWTSKCPRAMFVRDHFQAKVFWTNTKNNSIPTPKSTLPKLQPSNVTCVPQLCSEELLWLIIWIQFIPSILSSSRKQRIPSKVCEIILNVFQSLNLVLIKFTEFTEWKEKIEQETCTNWYIYSTQSDTTYYSVTCG